MHLEAWAREEITAQVRVGEGIAAQEAALRASDLAAFEAATLRVQRDADASNERHKRRDRIVAGIAQHYGVSARHVTLASVIERAGPEAGSLPELRRELRSAAQDAARRMRRLRRVMVVLRDLNREILGSFLGSTGARALDDEGSLVNAEA